MPTLTTEQKMVLEMVRQVSREVLWELAPEYDRTGAYPWPQLRKLGQLGLLGMTTPEAWGGAGLDSVTWALALEEIAAADPSVAVILSVTSGLPQYMLLRFGSEAQKKKYLVPLAKGEWIGAFCLSEPHAGSDPASLKTRAQRVPGGWRLDGVKSWVTSGRQAQVYVVMARSEAGISSFIVEKDSPGLGFGQPEEKMGLPRRPHLRGSAGGGLCPGGEPAGPGRPGAGPGLGRARLGPHRNRRPGRGHGPGGL